MTGGSNPAIRTLFYRLVRLLSLSIIPIFVFDGPNKPLFKRNKRSRGPGDSVSVAMAKRLFKLFGFHIHDAPGEAEAECALLQQQGIVDAVLSEDVDTIMFGCKKTIRNWSAEASRSAVAPTHVSVYDAAELKQGETGLEREGMVLVALMSGGDYIPEGVPGCGIKLACEAAKAGFGRRLCRIKRSDSHAVKEWREDLKRELQTNESNYFRRKRKALVIPDEFPDMDVLRYYTHPVVSEATTIEKLRREFPSRKEIDFPGLRAFTAETFDWTYKSGAIRLVKILAPSVLNQALWDMSQKVIDSDDPSVREAIEARLVKAISTRRTHFNTDATPELRISYIPSDIVHIDLEAEEDEPVSSYGRSGLALNSDNEEADTQIDDGTGSAPKKVFDPFQLDLAWVPETIVKLGAPLTVEDWEAKQRSKQLAKEKKAPSGRSKKKAPDMPTGALDKWVKSTKPPGSTLPKEFETPAIFLPFSPPALSIPPSLQQSRPRRTAAATQRAKSAKDNTSTEIPPKSGYTNKSRANELAPRPSLDVNPWSIASSQTTPKICRTKACNDLGGSQQREAILISSSPVRSASPVLARSTTAISPAKGSSRTQDPFEDCCSPQPASKATPDHASSPGRYNRSSEETICNPKAKQPPQRRDVTEIRGKSVTSRSTRAHRTAKVAAQVSIKSFGRNTETMTKRSTTSKPDFPELISLGSDDDEEESQDVRALGSGQPINNDMKLHGPLIPPYIAAAAVFGTPKRSHAGAPHSSANKRSAGMTIRRPSSPAAESSPPFDSPRAPSSTSGMTRLYCSATSAGDHGLGFFEEVQVTRAEADRIMSQYELENAKRPGARRMWRESEVTILDLTGED